MPDKIIVDTHHHLCSGAYVDLIKATAGLNPYSERVLRNGTPEKSLEDMDRAGVTRSIISLTTPGVWLFDGAEARRVARETNEHFARIAADHPGRYGMFAAVPMPDIDGTLKEIEYALDHLKADGIGFFTSYDEKYLGEAAFAPVFEELNRRKAVVYTHPRRPDCCANLVPEVSEAVIEYGTDTTRTVASLVFGGTATRSPDIKFLFSHAGGSLPFLSGRFVHHARQPQYARILPKGLLHELQRFYYDLAQSTNPGATSSLMKLVKISQVLFGTDFPYGTAAEHLKELAECGFSEQELKAIFSDNPAAVMPRCRA